MSWIPAPVDELLAAALVCEMTVVGAKGQPVTHPLLPLWDGERIYVTSSVLFSRKLEHIKRDGKVSVAITDPAACGGRATRCAVQGDARVFEDDPHETWMQVLLWRPRSRALRFVGSASRCRSSSARSSRSPRRFLVAGRRHDRAKSWCAGARAMKIGDAASSGYRTPSCMGRRRGYPMQTALSRGRRARRCARPTGARRSTAR
jgi:hypothetical protein